MNFILKESEQIPPLTGEGPPPHFGKPSKERGFDRSPLPNPWPITLMARNNMNVMVGGRNPTPACWIQEAQG
jgi:hypothetical protein